MLGDSERSTGQTVSLVISSVQPESVFHQVMLDCEYAFTSF